MRLEEQPGVARAIRRFVDHIRGLDGVLEVVLFGSSVRDDWRPESDVDLLVVVDRKTWALVEAIHGTWWESRLADHVDVSPRIVTREQLDALRAEGHPLIRAVDREGIPLWTRAFEPRSEGI